jgi:SAM-dependent methyltransferase
MRGAGRSSLDPELLMSVRDLPDLVKQRREFLYRHLDIEVSSTLEIGTLNTPTIRPGECQASFLDWFSTDELRHKHLTNPRVNTDELVEVDHVVRSRDFADIVPDKVDALIANHVIEHVPDPIHWLEQAGRCTEPDGRLFLCVPDRRYTFDFFRRESDAVDLIVANNEAHEMPTAADIARHLYYLTDVTHLQIWENGPPVAFHARMTFAAALEQAQKLSATYTDVHCWVFTEESLLRTFEALRSSGHIRWEIVAFEGVQPGQNEMRVLLRRS